jgi:hypothetical protein
MKSLSVALIFSTIFTYAAASNAGERKLYVGKDSTEAILSFDATLDIQSFGGQPSEDEAKRQIETQVTFLFGTLSNEPLTAAPRGDHTIKINSIKPSTDNTWTANYSFEGKIAILKGDQEEKSFEITIDLPRNIYLTADGCGDGEHDTSAFWWVFNPRKPGCSLVEGKDYDGIKAKVARIEVPQTTYPEYARLVDSKGNITIDLLMGIAGEAGDESLLNPLADSNYDENATNFRSLRSMLLSQGFSEKQWTPEDIVKFAGTTEGHRPFVTQLEKKLKKAKIVVRMFFGVTNVGHDGAGWFYQFLADSLQNNSVMIYSGHSSLGQGLNLGQIERYLGFGFHLVPNKDRYQIYYFNGCSSYGYYNQDYFARKATPQDPNGTQNLEVLTNGLSTYFYTMGPADLYFVRAIMAWADGKGSISYQALADKIDSGNLFGVNGDTDAGNLKP